MIAMVKLIGRNSITGNNTNNYALGLQCSCHMVLICPISAFIPLVPTILEFAFLCMANQALTAFRAATASQTSTTPQSSTTALQLLHLLPCFCTQPSLQGMLKLGRLMNGCRLDHPRLCPAEEGCHGAICA